MREAEIQNEFNKKALEINAEKELYQMDLKIKKESEV